MSTFYAAFPSVGQARATVGDLLRGGVAPDDLSVLSRDDSPDGGSSRGIHEETHSVGDATAFVGREDDPRLDEFVPAGAEYTEMTSVEEAKGVYGISTAETESNVESLDQNTDGQEQVDRDTYGESRTQSEHERDDLNLVLRTGFPTPIPLLDDVKDTETQLQDQMSDALDVLVIPGRGILMGGGALATAALDFIRPEEPSPNALIDHLLDEGVPRREAEAYQAAFKEGWTLLAVNVTPGVVSEQGVEQIALRNGAERLAMYDAPRFYNEGGRMSKTGDGNS